MSTKRVTFEGVQYEASFMRDGIVWAHFIGKRGKPVKAYRLGRHVDGEIVSLQATVRR